MELVKKDENELRKSSVTTGYIPVDNFVTRKILKECGASAFAVYCVILSHRNYSDGHKCYPSLDLIMYETSFSRSTVRDSIKSLSENGFLDYVSGYFGKSNDYSFPYVDFAEKTNLYSKKKEDQIYPNFEGKTIPVRKPRKPEFCCDKLLDEAFSQIKIEEKDDFEF